jgi:hypothetical protein
MKWQRASTLRAAPMPAVHRAGLCSMAASAVLACSWSFIAHAELRFDVDAGARYESNVTRAQQQDVRDDGTATPSHRREPFFLERR